MESKNNNHKKPSEVGMEKDERRKDDGKIDEILMIVKQLDICVRGKADDYRDGGLIGQVAHNTTSIKWLRGLFFSLILVMLGLIVQGMYF